MFIYFPRFWSLQFLTNLPYCKQPNTGHESSRMHRLKWSGQRKSQISKLYCTIRTGTITEIYSNHLCVPIFLNRKTYALHITVFVLLIDITQSLRSENDQLRQQVLALTGQIQRYAQRPQSQHPHQSDFWEVPRNEVTLNMQTFHSHFLTLKFALYNKAPGTSTKNLLHVECNFISWDFPKVALVGVLRPWLLCIPLNLPSKCQYLLSQLIIFTP